MNISLSAAELAKFVLSHPELKSAVLTAYLAENAPELVVPDAADEESESYPVPA